VRTGAGNGGDDVAAGGGSGKSWRVRRRAAGEGNRAGVGRGRRVGVIPAGGGAVARGEALRRRQGKTEQSSTCPRKKKRGRGSGGPVWKF
jgi:hypothetical protein